MSRTAATKTNNNQKERACCSDKAYNKQRAKQITTRKAKRTITREQNKRRLLLGKESSGREQLHAGARPLQSSHWLVGGGVNIIILKFDNLKKKNVHYNHAAEITCNEQRHQQIRLLDRPTLVQLNVLYLYSISFKSTISKASRWPPI